MSNQVSKNIRLGIMVVVATLSLIVAMYMIGDKRNLFGSTIQVSAFFKSVDGLKVGNNVRFAGIDVGTVTNIELVNETTVRIDMAIDLESQQFIKKNATVSIGSDGLMGNKLVNINPGPSPGRAIENGDILASFVQFETENALRTLTTTNDDIAAIAYNLRIFTETLNRPNSMWSLLTDTATARRVEEAVINFYITSKYAANGTGQLVQLVTDVKSGKGTMGQLLTDTTFFSSLQQTMSNMEHLSDSLAGIPGDINRVTDMILDGDGAFQTIMRDSAFDANLSESVENLNKASQDLEENMEALKHNFIFRRYFRKKAQAVEKNRKQID